MCKRCLLCIATALALCVSASAVVATVTANVTAAFSPAGKLSVPASVNLTHTGTIFNPYTGVATINYRARTVNGGTITLRVTSDFALGGPSVAAGDLHYSCGAATLGNACSGSISASTSAATPVLALPSGSCTGVACGNADPNSVPVSFTLTDSPVTKTGSYSANVQFTISST